MKPPKVVCDAVADYRENNDWLGKFLNENCIMDASYQEKSGEEIRRMFNGHTGAKTYDDWMEAFWKRKYESDFSREMSRSMDVYLKEFQE